MSELEQRPVQIDRDMSRANWQRGIGAVVCRELTEEAFSAEPAIDHLIYGSLGNEVRHSGLGHIEPLWATAYTVSNIAVRTAMVNVRRRAVSLIDNQGAPLFRVGLDIRQHAFWSSANSVFEEVGDTVAHFPISLARTISEHAAASARTQDGSKRFLPKSLNDVADLLESPDVQLMFDQALLPANGFWGTFSTRAEGLDRSRLTVYPYAFTEGQVAFSDAALQQMRESIKAANTTSNVNETSSSGCPARHMAINPRYIPDKGRLIELSKAFGKTPEELLALHERNVAQTGLQFVISALRAGNRAGEKYLDGLLRIET